MGAGLQIGYDKRFGGEESALVVMEYEYMNQTFNLLNNFRNDEADWIFKVLTEEKGMVQKRILKKEEFLKSEFGSELECTITAWDEALEKHNRTGEDKDILRTLAWCQAQWEVYRMAMKQFYGVEYHFTRTDEYYGLCTEDETDFLFKKYRK